MWLLIRAVKGLQKVNMFTLKTESVVAHFNHSLSTIRDPKTAELRPVRNYPLYYGNIFQAKREAQLYEPSGRKGVQQSNARHPTDNNDEITCSTGTKHTLCSVVLDLTSWEKNQGDTCT